MFELKIEDLPELERVQRESGANWVACDADGFSYWFSDKPVHSEQYVGEWDNPTGHYGRFDWESGKAKTFDPEPLNIAAAIAQIKAQSAATVIPVSRKPLTWNERINLMTVEERAEFSMNEWCQMHNEAANYAWEQPEAFAERFKERMTELLNSPCEGGEKG